VTIDELREAVRDFAACYNAEWLIEKNGDLSSLDARAKWMDAKPPTRGIILTRVQGSGCGTRTAHSEGPSRNGLLRFSRHPYGR
jgi:hypothetical protein